MLFDDFNFGEELANFVFPGIKLRRAVAEKGVYV
jgi:hypothetical protein